MKKLITRITLKALQAKEILRSTRGENFVDSGIKILQYREKEKKAGQMLKECLELRRLTREAGACFIVNDHVDIAVLCEADGVHVGQELSLIHISEPTGP